MPRTRRVERKESVRRMCKDSDIKRGSTKNYNNFFSVAQSLNMYGSYNKQSYGTKSPDDEKT